MKIRKPESPDTVTINADHLCDKRPTAKQYQTQVFSYIEVGNDFGNRGPRVKRISSNSHELNLCTLYRLTALKKNNSLCIKQTITSNSRRHL